MSRELDVEVAEKVMEWKRHRVTWVPCSQGGVWECPDCGAGYASPPWTKEKVELEWCESGTLGRRSFAHETPNYSTSIADAWLVVDRMKELDWPYCTVQRFVADEDKLAERAIHTGWWASFERHRSPVEAKSPECASASEAICKAALRAVGAPPEGGQ